MAQSRRSITRKIIIALVLLYVTCGLLLFLLQDLIFFHPTAVVSSYQYRFEQPYTELNLPVAGNNLNVVCFEPATSSKGLVLFFHGNMRNVEHYAKYAELITSQGYTLWMPDYPGFGKTTGKRTEERMYNDALLAYAVALKQFPSGKIIIYGKSIGTGVASFLAAQRQSKLLVLETPYYSIRSMAMKYLPMYPFPSMLRYQFPNNEHLKKVQQPVVLIHGTNDELIPVSQARKLHAENPGSDLLTISKGGHNDLSDFAVFRAKLAQLLN
jgi:uncharacterized protein